METNVTPEAARLPRQYVEFNPTCAWLHGHNCESLILDLPGFKKEQIIVLVNTHRKLKIKGERHIGGHQWSRFTKDLVVPKHCDFKGAQAKYDDDKKILRVTLPMKLKLASNTSAQNSPSMLKLKLKERLLFNHYRLKESCESLCRLMCIRIDVNDSDKKEARIENKERTNV